MTAKVELGIPQMLPCPFCGKNVELAFHAGDYGYMPPSCSIRCKSCDVGFSHKTREWEHKRGHFSIKEEAIKYVLEKWNGNRKPPAENIPAPSPPLATDCNLNPLNNGVYQWGDRLKTSVVIHEDGSAVIAQGENRVELDCAGFFADVASVLENAIDAMPDGERKTTLMYRSLPTSRRLPGAGWWG